MILTMTLIPDNYFSKPRASGDDPSPGGADGEERVVNPARAGMILNCGAEIGARGGKPRASGDDPSGAPDPR